MNILRQVFFVFLFISLVSNAAIACNRNDMLRVYYFMFSADTYLPIKFKDIKNDPGGFMMDKDDFSHLVLASQPAKETDFFENIRMRIQTKKGLFYINKDGVIFFKKKIFGQLDKKILNSIDLGFGLYELKTCEPLNIRMIKLVKQGGNKKLKDYLDQAGELADWRNKGFIGYDSNKPD